MEQSQALDVGVGTNQRNELRIVLRLVFTILQSAHPNPHSLALSKEFHIPATESSSPVCVSTQPQPSHSPYPTPHSQHQRHSPPPSCSASHNTSPHPAPSPRSPAPNYSNSTAPSTGTCSACATPSDACLHHHRRRLVGGSAVQRRGSRCCLRPCGLRIGPRWRGGCRI